MSNLDAINGLLASLFPGLMGMTLTGVTPERVTGRLTVRPELCTTGEILHGGALMAFADTLGAVGTVANLRGSASTTTIASSTKFLGPAPLGATIVGECRPFHRGRTTMVWQTEVRLETGKLCAIVTQTQLVMAG